MVGKLEYLYNKPIGITTVIAEYPVQIWVLAPLTSVYDWGLIICSSRKPVGKLGIWVHILQIMDIFLLSNIQLAHADVPQE